MISKDDIKKKKKERNQLLLFDLTKKEALVNSHTKYTLFSYMDCLIETGMKKWQSNIFWDLLQCFVCFIMNHLAASVKRLET